MKVVLMNCTHVITPYACAKSYAMCRSVYVIHKWFKSILHFSSTCRMSQSSRGVIKAALKPTLLTMIIRLTHSFHITQRIQHKITILLRKQSYKIQIWNQFKPVHTIVQTRNICTRSAAFILGLTSGKSNSF